MACVWNPWRPSPASVDTAISVHYIQGFLAPVAHPEAASGPLARESCAGLPRKRKWKRRSGGLAGTIRHALGSATGGLAQHHQSSDEISSVRFCRCTDSPSLEPDIEDHTMRQMLMCAARVEVTVRSFAPCHSAHAAARHIAETIISHLAASYRLNISKTDRASARKSLQTWQGFLPWGARVGRYARGRCQRDRLCTSRMSDFP